MHNWAEILYLLIQAKKSFAHNCTPRQRLNWWIGTKWISSIFPVPIQNRFSEIEAQNPQPECRGARNCDQLLSVPVFTQHCKQHQMIWNVQICFRILCELGLNVWVKTDDYVTQLLTCGDQSRHGINTPVTFPGFCAQSGQKKNPHWLWMPGPRRFPPLSWTHVTANFRSVWGLIHTGTGRDARGEANSDTKILLVTTVVCNCRHQAMCDATSVRIGQDPFLRITRPVLLPSVDEGSVKESHNCQQEPQVQTGLMDHAGYRAGGQLHRPQWNKPRCSTLRDRSSTQLISCSLSQTHHLLVTGCLKDPHTPAHSTVLYPPTDSQSHRFSPNFFRNIWTLELRSIHTEPELAFNRNWVDELPQT